ncbi:CU044_5270 family protein [Streptomyces collinus]|uniref:CU044_5270 family protein n=1 Tax=Streptomyces collinus TaxID=42684 RepID=UPI00339E3B71
MTEVRELRIHAPVPDRARLAPGRARLMNAVQAVESRRVSWRRRQFVLVAVVAAVIAVAVTATLLVGGKGMGRKVQPAATPSVRFKGVSAAEFLRQAADAVRAQPEDAAPTAKQWIYIKSAPEPAVRSSSATGDGESWVRYDGSAMATRMPNGQLSVAKLHLENGQEGDDRSPREMYQVLIALPTDGRETLKALRKQNAIADSEGLPEARDDFLEISALLSADVMPAKGLASLYRALALVPGGKITGHLVETSAGRRAIAVDYLRGKNNKTGASMRDQVLIDPHTYRIVGKRIVTGSGKVLYGSSLIATAVVDQAGDRG